MSVYCKIYIIIIVAFKNNSKLSFLMSFIVICYLNMYYKIFQYFIFLNFKFNNQITTFELYVYVCMY